jgi:hypothetical protein
MERMSTETGRFADGFAFRNGKMIQPRVALNASAKHWSGII